MNKRLCKSNRNRTIFGVCGGIGEYFNVDPTLIRIGFIAFGIWRFRIIVVPCLCFNHAK